MNPADLPASSIASSDDAFVDHPPSDDPARMHAPQRGVTSGAPARRERGIWRPDYSRGSQPRPAGDAPPPPPGIAAVDRSPTHGDVAAGPGPSPGRHRRAPLVAGLCLVSALAGGFAGADLASGEAGAAVPSATSTSSSSDVPGSTPAARGAANAPTPSPSAAPPSGASSPSVASSPSPETGSPAPVAAATETEATIIRAVESVGPAVVTLRVGSPRGGGGSGSGVIVSADGLILTNRHVIAGASSVTVVLADGREVEGRVSGVDTLTDLALVEVEGDGYPTAPLGESRSLRVGQTVIAMGDPLGEFPGSVTAGIISALDRTVVVGDAQTGESEALRHLIQTDAAINPGNSGGPLVDTQGRVVGIDTAEARQAEGIGFAIPIDVARPIVVQALAGEPIRRPWLGVTFESVDARVADEEDLRVDHGALIRQPEGSSTPAVVDGSPAEDAGLREGDVITALNGQRVDRDHPLDLLLLAHAPDERVTLTVVRDGATRTVDVALGERPADLG